MCTDSFRPHMAGRSFRPHMSVDSHTFPARPLSNLIPTRVHIRHRAAQSPRCAPHSRRLHLTAHGRTYSDEAALQDRHLSAPAGAASPGHHLRYEHIQQASYHQNYSPVLWQTFVPPRGAVFVTGKRQTYYLTSPSFNMSRY